MTPATPFEVFFDLVPTGAVLYAPVFDASDDVVDFRFVRLNPAGQRLLGLPAHPPRTFREQYPHSVATGIFAQYRTAYLTGDAATYDVPYEQDGSDTVFHVVAQRSGELLVVSFTDTADQSRTPVENALREARTAAQAARAEAETQRQRFYDLLMQLPAQVAVHESIDQVFTLVNPGYQRLAPGRDLLGQPIREAWPELVSQGILEVLDQVYRTGEPFIGTELPFQIDFARTGQPEQVYFNAFFLPLRNPQGQVTGVLDFSYDVTEQVLARRQLEQLNQELEARVQARAHEAEAARAEAEQQRARLARLWQQAPAAICMLSGPELIFELVNPVYQQFFPGRPLLGKALREALPELADHAAYHSMKQVYDTGETLWQQALHVPLARTEEGVLEDRYFNYIQQPRYDEQGRIDGVLVFGFEVTELVQAQQRAEALQEQVRQSAERLQQERDAFYQIFALTPAAICIQRGPAHHYAYANQAYQDFFPGRQLLGRSVAEALPETVESGVVALLDHVYQTGETYYGEELPLLIAQPAGPPQWMYFTFTYQAFRENGEIVGISTFAYNVAEQVTARQQREQQQQQLHALFEQAPVAIAIFRGPQYVIELANPAVCAIWGRTPQQAVGTPLFELLPEAAGQGFEQLLDGVLQTGSPYVATELPSYIHRASRRDLVYWNFVYQPLPDAQGHVTGVTMVATEVSEQVQARQRVQGLNEELAAINEKLQGTNEELQQTNRQLTRTNVDLDNFIYTASHDLKQPIANIEGLLLALQHELPATSMVGQVPTMLHLMQEAVERFGRTIGHLTDVARLQQAHAQPPTHVNLARVVQEVQLDLAPLITQTAAQVLVAVPDYVTLLFSEKNLRSVVYNLLSNALKYHHPDRAPVVHLTYQPETAYQVLDVQDNGLGLDLTKGQDKLFAMFQRLHTHIEGTGLGLYMVKKMVENVGGRLAVQSELDQGSTFRVYFPR
ncbi:MAG: PAS domain-containing protein [Janthinobacterium lividum]